MSGFPRCLSELELGHVHALQLLRGIYSRVLQPFEQREDVANTSEIDVMLPCQCLDGLELHHVSARVTPAIGNGALGRNHAQVLVHHQGAGMYLEDLGGHAESENWLVEIDRA